MTDLKEQVLKELCSIPPPPYAAVHERMECFSDGQECENARLTPLLTALADCVLALEYRKMHDDDCADSSEKFQTHEMCECGASYAKQALASLRKVLK